MKEIVFRGKTYDGKWVAGLLFRKMKKATALDYCTHGKRILSEFYIQTVKTVNAVDILEEYKVVPSKIYWYIRDSEEGV